MNLPPGPNRPPEEPRRPPPWIIVVALLAVVCGAVIWVSNRRPPPLPIPVPISLARIDPQIRDHLTRIARDVAAAPYDASRRAELGLAFAANNLWTEARQCFLDANRLGEPGPLPALYAAAALVEGGNIAQASAEWRDVTRHFPDFAPAWQRLGTVLIQLGDLPGAAEAFTNVTRIAPREWPGWAGLGEVRIRMGQAAGAVEPLARAVALDPYARTARHLLAQAYRATGRTAEADHQAAAGSSQSVGPMSDPWSEKALAHMKSVSDQLDQADILITRGRASEAIGLLRETLRFHPTNQVVLGRMAAAFNAGNEAESAWRLLEPLLRTQTNDASLFIAATHSAAALGRTNEALQLGRHAIFLAPNFAEAHVAEADALVAAGRDAEAAQALQRALTLAPRNVALLIQLGDLQWHNLAQPSEALDTYLRAQTLDPIHPATLERIASLHTRRHDFLEADRAIADLRRLGGDPGLLDGLEKDLREARANR